MTAPTGVTELIVTFEITGAVVSAGGVIIVVTGSGTVGVGGGVGAGVGSGVGAGAGGGVGAGSAATGGGVTSSWAKAGAELNKKRLIVRVVATYFFIDM